MKKYLFIPLVLLTLLLSHALQAQTQGGFPTVITDPSKAFVAGSIVVKGEGAAPSGTGLSNAQKRIMALRAAKIVALREVAEIINGVSISGNTAVLDASTRSDAIRSTVNGLVKGAVVVREAYDPLSEVGVVYVKVPMTGPDGVIASLLPQVAPTVEPRRVYAPGVAPAREVSYDGLILDVRQLPFRPALINRILSKNGEVIYDPTKVAQNILVERGAAEYTNDVGKARALLGERGSSNPLIVKGGGVVGATDVEVAPDAASSIFASNQAANYLEGARVVFVLR